MIKLKNINIKKVIKRILLREKSDSDSYIKYLKRRGIKIGKNCIIYSPTKTVIDVQNPFMLEIGDNVKISTDVKILTHDFSWCVTSGIDGCITGSVGKVTIGNNVFIGMSAIITRNVKIGNNVIIGAGSIVTHDCEDNFVYAGVPAKKIMTIEEYHNKRKMQQQEDAKKLVYEYRKKYEKDPTIRELREFIFLFTNKTNSNNEVVQEILKDSGHYNKCVEYLNNHDSKYNRNRRFFKKYIIKKEKYMKESEKIKVSIVVPVYNVEKYIGRCLESLIHQTLQEIEIIIVNDGSTDSSLKICNKYAERDNRIRVFSKQNEGLGLTRNYGIRKAKGEYIAFLDSDDYIDVDFYEKMYTIVKEKNVESCFAEIKQVDNNGNIRIFDKIPFQEEVVESKSVLYNILHEYTKKCEKKFMQMCVWRTIYKRETIEKLQLKFVSEREYISEDIIFNIDFLMQSKKTTFARDTYYYYCFNGISLTNKYKNDRLEKDIILYKELKKRLKKYNEYENLKIGLDNFFLGYVRALIKQESGKGSPYNYKIKIKKIKEIINNTDIKEIIKSRRYETLKRFIYDFFIRIRFATILYVLSKF